MTPIFSNPEVKAGDTTFSNPEVKVVRSTTNNRNVGETATFDLRNVVGKQPLLGVKTATFGGVNSHFWV